MFLFLSLKRALDPLGKAIDALQAPSNGDSQVRMNQKREDEVGKIGQVGKIGKAGKVNREGWKGRECWR